MKCPACGFDENRELVDMARMFDRLLSEVPEKLLRAYDLYEPWMESLRLRERQQRESDAWEPCGCGCHS